MPKISKPALRVNLTTKEKADSWETTYPLFLALYREIQELSKKKPEATLNENKVRIINRLLADIQVILSEEKENKYLELLEDAALPQYSDVAILLSQYGAALKKFKDNYFVSTGYGSDNYWRTE